ncbi:hypothetical protein PIB30_058711 [Stylosanthes scabra]|uniref:Transposase (Putative), gypsy type n=1 Tax=Stylosanthes scabra TaxID=79078 RepID=A0ABU6QKN2_9FABA|nr:hypothetical protein [Stylosanthes scabra]
MVLGDSLPELRRSMRLMEEAAAEGDFVLEEAGPSHRLPLRADEDGPHFLWVYQELFTCLGVRLPFTDFQREVMTRCRVAVSQLYLNGWGLLRTFEKVCLHFGFKPTSRLFLYIYDILIPPTGYGFISFRARQGCKLFGIFEESIQEFKLHYFKVLPAPGCRAFWLDDGGKPFPWVYWNREVKDFVIHELDPLVTAVFEFLVSLPVGLPKRNSLTCRWILDNNDAVVGKYLGISLNFYVSALIKKTKLDRMMEMMADPSRMAPRSVLPTGVPAVAAVATASAAPAGSSVNPATPSVQAEAQEMCQETLEIVLDQVSHLCPGVDFSAITLKTRWDPKGKRIHVPEELLGDGAEVAETLPEVVPEQQQEQGIASAGVSGEFPT